MGSSCPQCDWLVMLAIGVLAIFIIQLMTEIHKLKQRLDNQFMTNSEMRAFQRQDIDDLLKRVAALEQDLNE